MYNEVSPGEYWLPLNRILFHSCVASLIFTVKHLLNNVLIPETCDLSELNRTATEINLFIIFSEIDLRPSKTLKKTHDNFMSMNFV